MLERFAAIIASFLLCASDAFAGAQLFEGSWSVKAFGNERTDGTGESEFYSAFRLPLGVQCNPLQPRCPFQSTPTDGAGGVFGPGQGPGSFDLPYKNGLITVARVRVKQGAAKFGGTMKMLGALTARSCYYRAGTCSVAEWKWRYDAVGAPAQTRSGVVTKGFITVNTPDGYPYCACDPGSPFSIIIQSAVRFPWTTGSATVTAVVRGPHRTVHYAKGYDNRTPTSGMGTIQLVSPTLTRWLQPVVKFETAGIAILRIKFAPEPHAGLTLAAGVGVLALGYRLRRSRSPASSPPH